VRVGAAEKKPLAGYYVTNITDPSPFTGVIEMTALVDPAELRGNTLVYLAEVCRRDRRSMVAQYAEIEAEFLDGLARLFPQFSRDDMLAFRVSRVRYVFALSTIGYSSHVPPIETSIPGLFS